jgi:transposase
MEKMSKDIEHKIVVEFSRPKKTVLRDLILEKYFNRDYKTSEISQKIGDLNTIFDIDSQLRNKYENIEKNINRDIREIINEQYNRELKEITETINKILSQK